MKRSIRYRLTVWILEALAAEWLSRSAAQWLGYTLRLRGFHRA
jgi:hypothetical protein